MAEENRPAQSKEQAEEFSTEIRKDRSIDSTVILLHYKNRREPARNITVGIAPELGSNMFRFQVGEHDLIHYEQDLLRRMDFTGNFVLWPLPNRIRDKRYNYEGNEYSLAEITRPQGNAVLIHGLVFDRSWQYEQPITQQDASSVTTYVEIKPGVRWYDAYPFDSRLALTYRLTKEGVSVTYRVHNQGNRDLPYGFALHPYFALLSGQDGTRVSIPASAVMEADNELLPTGRILDVTTTMYRMFDLRKPRPVGELRLDHVYTSLIKNEVALIDYKKQSLQLRIATTDDFTHTVIYTQEGAPYFCLEHQTCSTDAVNLHNRGGELQKEAHLLKLKPGEVGTGSIDYILIFG